ncbi:acyl carrier protein [Rhizobium leguminosarum]|jgi:acyl carrier protein|uniref:Putative acyl carrier protein n=1 Tax=Rhizobium leguminosarum TaxID=384 RepID=A0A2K9YY28_RHILE|nr:acyl carrier protein [Rhizobium leguminosarum]AUW40886.1 putative acyl carrier protein [Rhizobium leguminosarum]
MTKNADILQRLQTIFRDELDLPNLTINADATPETVDGWDSLATIRIIAAAEREFGVMFEAAQIEDVHSVADIISVIES